MTLNHLQHADSATSATPAGFRTYVDL